MPQTYYLGGRTPLITWTACLLWALSSLLAALGGWGGSTAPAWLVALGGLAALGLAVAGAGLWWRQEWARRATVAGLLLAGGVGLALPWSLKGQVVLAALVAVPASAGLLWLAGRLNAPAERARFLA